MLRKLLSIILILTTCFLSAPAFANDKAPVVPDKGNNRITLPDPPPPLPGEPNVGPAISPMKWGQKAPFTGVLLSTKAVAIVMTELNTIEERIKIEVDKTDAICEANCNFRVEQLRIAMNADIKILKVQLEAREKENAILAERLEDAEDQIAPVWWLGGGFVAGALVTILIVWGSSSASK